MHADEVRIDRGLVRRLVASQFPQWARLVVAPVASTGTVNAIWRLGVDMYVRLPRVRDWARDLEKELKWLPVLAAQVSVVVPQPIAAGAPQFGYPFTWAIYQWHDGDVFDVSCVVDERRAAEDLAQFVVELRRINTAGAPRSRRDRPLHARDPEIRAAIAASRDVVTSMP